jgi:RNA polymerase-binding transcription factor DksA
VITPRDEADVFDVGAGPHTHRKGLDMRTASTDFARQRQFESSPLTAHELTTLRVRLTEALADHRRNFEHNEALATSLTRDNDDDVARDRETARVAADLAREAIADIEHALERLERDSYGTCEACQRPLPFDRLDAIPQARHCVSCASPGVLVR